MIIERLLALPVPRLVVGALWLSVLVVGAWRMHKREVSRPIEKTPSAVKITTCPSTSVLRGRPHYSALREMAVNHRIVESDVDWTDTQGKDLNQSNFNARYLACPVHAGDPVVADELRDTPAVQPSAGRLVYLLPVIEPGSKSSDLDVGSQLDVFEQNKPLLRKAQILAIQCSDSSAAHCSALLDLTPSEGELLMHSDFGKLYIVRLHQ